MSLVSDLVSAQGPVKTSQWTSYITLQPSSLDPSAVVGTEPCVGETNYQDYDSPLIIQTINSSSLPLPANTHISYITKLEFCCSCWAGFTTTTPSPSPVSSQLGTERIMSCEIKEIAFIINLDNILIEI